MTSSNQCDPNIQIIIEDDTLPQCNHCRNKRLRRVSPALFTLSTSSKYISFPKSNQILCNTSSATGEDVYTMEGFKTSVLTFLRPTFEADYVNNVSKRYVTISLFSDDLNTQKYSISIMTQNISGNLRTVMNYELNGVVKKTEILDDKTWNTFSFILHERELVILIDNIEWHVQIRDPFSGTKVYRGLFNVNHEKTEIKNITFSYFQGNSVKSDYSVPNNLPILNNTYRFDYADGAINDLTDVSGGDISGGLIGDPITLYIQNIHYDLSSNNHIPVINTLVSAKNIIGNPTSNLSFNAYTDKIYLSTDNTNGTLYTPLFTDTSLNIQSKLLSGKAVFQKFSYVNVDGSGQVFSDLQVYM